MPLPGRVLRHTGHQKNRAYHLPIRISRSEFGTSYANDKKAEIKEGKGILQNKDADGGTGFWQPAAILWTEMGKCQGDKKRQ